MPDSVRPTRLWADVKVNRAEALATVAWIKAIENKGIQLPAAVMLVNKKLLEAFDEPDDQTYGVPA